MASAKIKNIGRDIKNIADFRNLFRSSANGSAPPMSVSQKILGWIVFIILIGIIAMTIYYVISIIFKGYSRTLRDLLQWNFSHRVDVKQEFADKNGPLYNALLYLGTVPPSNMEFLRSLGLSFDVIGACESDDCEDVFKNLLSILNTYYEPDFKDTKLMQALIDYIAYHDKITDDLSMKALTSQQRINKVNFILESIYDYMQTYAGIVDRQVKINCRLNSMKGDDARAQYEKETNIMKKGLDQYLTTYGIQSIPTDKEFARFFTDLYYINDCGKTFSNVYNDLLIGVKYKENYLDKVKVLVNDIQQLTADLRKAKSETDRNELMTKIKNAQKTKLSIEIEMARIRKRATERAKEILGEQSSKLSKTSTNINNSDALVVRDGEDKEPLTTPRVDGKMCRIFVPCYKAYMHYVKYYLDPATKKSLYEKEMGDDEIVGYLFMNDLEFIQDSVSKANQQPFIIRILKMYCAFENIAMRVKDVIEGSLIRKSLMNILHAGDNTDLLKLDVNEYKQLLNMYISNKFIRLPIRTVYTWYFMELMYMIVVGKDIAFNVMLQRLKEIVSIEDSNIGRRTTVQLAQRVNTFMNMMIHENNDYTNADRTPSKDVNNVAKLTRELDLSSKMQEFILHYPTFCTIYFSSLGMLDSNKVSQVEYKNANDNAKAIYNQTGNVMSSLVSNVGLKLDDGFNNAYDVLFKKVHALKQFLLHCHMVHLYFTQYRHVIVEKDKVSKTRYEREGFVELYNEQFMDSSEFFNKLITPFKKNLIDNRVASEWKKTFYGERFKKNSKISYWIEFEAFWIGTLRPKADKMIKTVWGDVGKSAKLRW